MVLSDREKEILKDLISNPSITSMALEHRHQLTRRQLGYSINKINEWIMSQNLPLIERTRRGQFIINQTVFSKINTNYEMRDFQTNAYTRHQRIQLILMMLIGSKEDLSLNHFAVEMKVSKNTIITDLKEVQEYLDKYQLKLVYTRKNGYIIDGDELQSRNFLIHITQQLIRVSNGKRDIQKVTGIPNTLLDEFNRRIEKIEGRLNIRFTDEKLNAMPYILIFTLRRIENGNTMDCFYENDRELLETKVYQVIQEELSDLELPLNEQLFIALQFLTANVYFSEHEAEEIIPGLIPAIDNMVRLFEKSTCISFQDRNQLLEKLLQHIQPAYYRIKYDLSEGFEALDFQSKEFIEFHHFVQRSINPLEKVIGHTIPEEEATYITMLIGGWMNRQGETIEGRTKAVVVCPQGVSVSKLIFNELSELFPEFIFLDHLSIREFQNYYFDYDIVFSTTILDVDKKVFVCNVFQNQEEKERLRKQVMMEIHDFVASDVDMNYLLNIIKNYAKIHDEKALKVELKNYIDRDDNEKIMKREILKDEINLNELIVPDHIILRNIAVSWEEALEIAAAPLLKKKYITEEYVQAMIANTKDPYIVISPNVAIPHASPEQGVNKLSMSLLLIRKGVTFLDKYVIHAIVVIAAVDKEQHILPLSQLVKFLADPVRKKEFFQCKTKAEVMKLLNHFLQSSQKG
ncbi:BglG family transcription antiterminator [Oceanobacillus locisalsi]|uniref:Ascorbate-specific PTS system EIIA component n=1 Tax=Oceanobacillus locisalsi TaxID=546107 RepID=A0ABW3NBT2_9BACI